MGNRRFNKTAKVIALLNSYHSLEGSDYSSNKDVNNAMEYCESEIIKLTGIDNIFELPANMDELIEFMKNI